MDWWISLPDTETKHSTLTHVHSHRNENQIKKKKKVEKNAYSTFPDLRIWTLFTSQQSDGGGSQGWAVPGLMEQPQGQEDP